MLKTPVKTPNPQKPANKPCKPKKAATVPKSVLLPYLRQLKALKTARADQKSPAGWFSVSKDGKTDDKDIEGYYLNQLSATRSVARAAIGRSHIKTKMFYEVNTTASANSAYAVSAGLAPELSSEFTAFAGLYDEFKVTGGVVRFQILNSQATPNVSSVWVGMGFDSTYNTTPTSVVDVLESSQSRLYGCAPEVVNNFCNPRSAAHDGLYSFPFHIPGQSVADASAVTGGTGIIPNFPGQWIAASSAAGTTTGYLRTYVQNPGATNVIQFRAVVELDCEWRERT